MTEERIEQAFIANYEHGGGSEQDRAPVQTVINAHHAVRHCNAELAANVQRLNAAIREAGLQNKPTALGEILGIGKWTAADLARRADTNPGRVTAGMSRTQRATRSRKRRTDNPIGSLDLCVSEQAS